MTRSEYAKHRDISLPTWLVPFEHGVSVHGAAVVYHHLWGFRNRRFTLQAIYRKPVAAVQIFESHASVLKQTIFPDLSAREILERHTVFGFFSRAHHDEVADRWAHELIHDQRAASGLKSYTEVGRANIRKERWHCPVCVEEDADEYGFSNWYCLPQLAGIDFCPKHGEPLIGVCGNCHKPLVPTEKLVWPSLRCANCGMSPKRGKPGHHSSAGAQLAKDCALLSRDELPQIRPMQWAEVTDNVLSEVGESAAALIWNELSQSWGTKLPEGLTEQAITEELNLLKSPSSVLPRLAIFGAIRRLGFPVKTSSASNDTVLRTVRLALARNLLPLGLAPALLAAKDPRDLVTTRSPISRIRAAIKGLPPDIASIVTRPRGKQVVPRSFHLNDQMDHDALRTSHRKKILWLLETKPTLRRKALWQKLPTSMMWLRAHDGQWLESVLPPKYSARKRR